MRRLTPIVSSPCIHVHLLLLPDCPWKFGAGKRGFVSLQVQVSELPVFLSCVCSRMPFSSICFELSPSLFLLLLLNKHLYWIPAVSQSAESWTKPLHLFWWGLLGFFFPLSFYLLSFIPSWFDVEEKKSIFGSTNMQTAHCFYSNPDSTGWECVTWDERPWERPDLSWKPGVAVPHLFC